jgi:hypothetical protein
MDVKSSSEVFIPPARGYGVTTLKILTEIFAAVRTLNLTHLNTDYILKACHKFELAINRTNSLIIF